MVGMSSARAADDRARAPATDEAPAAPEADRKSVV